MNIRLDDLRLALEAVPSILLDDDLARGVDDAKAAVDALEQFVPDPTVVVVSGPAGSGKSSLVNALVGEAVATVSPIRPTTTAVTAFGAPGEVRIAGATDFVETDALPSGIVVVDTPPWDRAPEAVAEMISKAALTIVVVTPARYGDETTRANLAVASSGADMELVVNRLPATGDVRDQIEDAVHERLDIDPLAVFSEGSEIRFDVSPLESVESNDAGMAKRRVLERAAAGSSRTIATALTAGAAQLGWVTRILRNTSDPEMSFDSVETVTWESARTDLVRRSLDLVDAYDTTVERDAGNELAARVRKSLSLPDPAGIADALDMWRDNLTSELMDGARFGWRRNSGRQMIERHGWVVVVDSNQPVPRRFARMLRAVEPATTTRARVTLTELLEVPAKARSGMWLAILEEAGSYRPGELLAAANALDGGQASDG